MKGGDGGCSGAEIKHTQGRETRGGWGKDERGVGPPPHLHTPSHCDHPIPGKQSKGGGWGWQGCNRPHSQGVPPQSSLSHSITAITPPLYVQTSQEGSGGGQGLG